MKNKIECPYCDGHAILHSEQKELSFRKESFRVRVHYYRCQKCNEEFTTTDVDTVTMLQLYNQYREKYDIPFPEEIKSLREKYVLSASKMSSILGLGINSYNNYEKGEVPSLANANLISMAQNPKSFLNLLRKVQDKFSVNIYDRLFARVNKAITETDEFDPFNWAIHYYNKPSKYSGYKTPDFDKVSGLISLFLQNCKEEYNDKLKLNKLLFYADFWNYKKNGSSITGISYRAIKYGPVPAYYDNIYALLESDNHIITEFTDDGHGGAREIFKSGIETNKEIFTELEIETIEEIINKFKNTPTWEVVKVSHNEIAWQKLNVENKIISYQDFAFDITGF